MINATINDIKTTYNNAVFVLLNGIIANVHGKSGSETCSLAVAYSNLINNPFLCTLDEMKAEQQNIDSTMVRYVLQANDGTYLKGAGYSKSWVNDLPKARLYRRKCDAKNSLNSISKHSSKYKKADVVEVYFTK